MMPADKRKVPRRRNAPEADAQGVARKRLHLLTYPSDSRRDACIRTAREQYAGGNATVAKLHLCSGRVGFHQRSHQRHE